MIRIYPFIFILLWSSAFITTKPIVDNSDPFSALAFRFFFVALGFYVFSIYTKQKLIVNQKNLIESVLSGVLFHGLYLGGVFYSISIGMPTGIAALIVTLQPVLTNARLKIKIQPIVITPLLLKPEIAVSISITLNRSNTPTAKKDVTSKGRISKLKNTIVSKTTKNKII